MEERGNNVYTGTEYAAECCAECRPKCGARPKENVAENRFVEGLLVEFESGMNERYGRIIVADDLWDTAIDLAKHEDPRVAFRTSWALEWAYFNGRQAFVPHVRHFLDVFFEAQNPSVHRHYTKMLYDMTHRGLVSLSDGDAELAAGKCFDLLIDSETRTAVKVWCMEILFDLGKRFDWVGEHLPEVVRGLLHNDPSRGMANRAAKILKRIGTSR